MEHLARRLGLRTDPTIFFVSAGVTIAFAIALVLFPEGIGDAFAAGRSWIVTNLGWFFMGGGVGVCRHVKGVSAHDAVRSLPPSIC